MQDRMISVTVEGETRWFAGDVAGRYAANGVAMTLYETPDGYFMHVDDGQSVNLLPVRMGGKSEEDADIEWITP